MKKSSYAELLAILFILVSISGCRSEYEEKARLCNAAFSARVEEGQPQLPALMLKQSDWEEDGWEVYSHPFMPDILEGQTINTLICIHESRQDTHDVYIGGAAVNPYRLIWDIRIVELPSGRVIGSGQFTGGDPPGEVRTSYESVDLYGNPPTAQLVRLADPVFGKIISLDGRINAIAFSPDGRYIVSSTSSALQMWNVETGELALDYDDIYSGSPVFSPDGGRLATTHNFSLRIWNATSDRLIHETENPDPLRALLYSPDGSLIIGMSYEKIFFWNAENGETIRTLELGDMNNMCISPKGDTLAVNSGFEQEAVITFLDPETGNEIRPQINTRASRFDCFYYSPDGRFLIIDGEILETATMQPVAGMGSKPTSVAGDQLLPPIPTMQYVNMPSYSSICSFSPDSRLIALEGNYDDLLALEALEGDYDYLIDVVLKDVLTGERVAFFAGHGGEITDFTFSPDGRWLAIAVQINDHKGYIRLGDVTPYIP